VLSGLLLSVCFGAEPDFDALDRLQRLRRARATQAATMLGAWGGVEVTAGSVVVITGATEMETGVIAGVGGLAHVATAWYGAEMGRRRYRAWSDRRPYLEAAGAWAPAVGDFRLSVEREGRAHAFATGVYTGVTVAGAILGISPGFDEDLRLLGATAAGIGAVGLAHHTNRWRFCIRLSIDADGILRGAPTSVGTGPTGG
jgi:hypothetical protein